jgi:hypothetical protein
MFNNVCYVIGCFINDHFHSQQPAKKVEGEAGFKLIAGGKPALRLISTNGGTCASAPGVVDIIDGKGGTGGPTK